LIYYHSLLIFSYFYFYLNFQIFYQLINFISMFLRYVFGLSFSRLIVEYLVLFSCKVNECVIKVNMVIVSWVFVGFGNCRFKIFLG